MSGRLPGCTPMTPPPAISTRSARPTARSRLLGSRDHSRGKLRHGFQSDRGSNPACRATSDDSFRVNPLTGVLSGVGTDLNPATDMGEIAYANNIAGAATTTLYGIRSDTMALVTIGGPDGTPSPNGGQVFAVGNLGIRWRSSEGSISRRTAPPIWSLSRSTSPVTSIYTVNLTTGAATLVRDRLTTWKTASLLGLSVEN